MPKTTTPAGTPTADYDIAVRQFKQQILPGGLWNTLNGRTDPFPATTVWSYGRSEDPLPAVAPAQNTTFNYPAFTVENTSMVATTVRWINDLRDPGTGNFLPHLLPIDQTLHWANPPQANCVMGDPFRTDCETAVAATYTGPVPIVTHVHGAHVQSHSDGYPEAWWLPAASNIPAGYAMRGSLFGQADNGNSVAGSAYFAYENTQPAATIWYHDHALGMTRSNVYAGPAGFWLIRGGANDTAAGVLPGPAPTLAGGDPNFSGAVRATIREIPIAIQDRSFDLVNGSGATVTDPTLAVEAKLFYPASRSFFDGFTGPYIDGATLSDISGIWNPEAFFNTMVVNGTTWPKYEVYPGRYRLRLLNGCNSRTLNLAMFVVSSDPDGIPGNADDVLDPLQEVPFYQIGGDQGFLPKVVMIKTGTATVLPGDGTVPNPLTAAAHADQALLLMSAERADVIVDFSGIANGTRIRMINTAPDAPFGGFPDVAAHALTTGQVMDFIVNTALPQQPSDTGSTAPASLSLPAEGRLGNSSVTRQLSLNELSSDQVCVEVDGNGAIIGTLFSTFAGDPNFLTNCANAIPTVPGNLPTPMGPRQARLGTMTIDSGSGKLIAVSKKWGDPITETPLLNDTELWEIFNGTADAHPIHLHLVGFEVINREDLDPYDLAVGNFVPTGMIYPPRPNETGFKDTVVAFPAQVTRLKARFDIAGRYVWHCHIVEHEDNEMMRTLMVSTDLLYAKFTGAEPGLWQWNQGTWNQLATSVPTSTAASGSTLYAGFGSFGVWKWDAGNTWTQINASTPESMVASGALLYGDFGTGGLSKWDGTVWSRLAPENPESIAVSGTILYADFGTGGLWKWSGTAWSQLAPENPEGIAVSGTILYADFGTAGLWKWSGTAWSQLAPENPEGIAVSGTILYADLGTAGLWKWDGTAWSQLASENPEGIAVSGTILYADLGTGGLWKWSGTAWSQLAPENPESIAVSGTILYADFGAGGLWKWDGTAWSLINPENPSDIVAAY